MVAVKLYIKKKKAIVWFMLTRFTKVNKNNNSYFYVIMIDDSIKSVRGVTHRFSTCCSLILLIQCVKLFNTTAAGLALIYLKNRSQHDSYSVACVSDISGIVSKSVKTAVRFFFLHTK